MNISQEMVLCFPRALLDQQGCFQGFRSDDGTIVEEFLTSGQVKFIERSRAEEDPSWKQLIPYVAITSGPKILHYVRGKKTGEERLKSLGSVGIGGHISTTDYTLFRQDMREVFAAGLAREIDEEIEIKSPFTQKIKGLINDDSNQVGKVHLGILILRILEEPKVEKREKPITLLEFQSLEELRNRRESLETWSQIVIDNWEKIQTS